MKIYRSEKARSMILSTYDQLIQRWGVDCIEQDVNTRYGQTHVIECGDSKSPPLILFHGVGDDSALMWLFNAAALAKSFHVFAMDTMGGPGKSCPGSGYDKSFIQAVWIDEALDGLHLGKVFLAGVSNGGYMVQRYTAERSERVTRSVCMSSGIYDQASGSPFIPMMKVFLPEALFPTRKNVMRLLRKMSGANAAVFIEDELLMTHYQWLLKGFNTTAMTFHKIVPFSPGHIKTIAGKTLFIRGGRDPLGDRDKAVASFERYDARHEIIEDAGHGINHEHAQDINRMMLDYFGVPSERET